MPFKSQAQAKYLFAKDPKLAKEFADKTLSIKKLPEKKVKPIKPKSDYTPGGDRTEGAIPPPKVVRKIVPEREDPYNLAVKSHGVNSPHARAQKYISSAKRMGMEVKAEDEELIAYPKKKQVK